MPTEVRLMKFGVQFLGKLTVARPGIPVTINESTSTVWSRTSNLRTAAWNSALSITSLLAPTRFTEVFRTLRISGLMVLAEASHAGLLAESELGLEVMVQEFARLPLTPPISAIGFRPSPCQ